MAPKNSEKVIGKTVTSKVKKLENKQKKRLLRRKLKKLRAAEEKEHKYRDLLSVENFVPDSNADDHSSDEFDEGEVEDSDSDPDQTPMDEASEELVEGMGEYYDDQHDIVRAKTGLTDKMVEMAVRADRRIVERKMGSYHKLMRLTDRVFWDSLPDKDKTDRELDDILPKDKGGNYVMIEDPNGPIQKLGKGCYRDVRTGDMFKRRGKSKDVQERGHSSRGIPTKFVGKRAGLKEMAKRLNIAPDDDSSDDDQMDEDDDEDD